MTLFDLQRALAGAKVVTISGVEVKELTTMTIYGVVNVVGVYKGDILCWDVYGVSKKGRGYKSLDLTMSPLSGSGFLYVFRDNSSIVHTTKRTINSAMFCFNLADYPVGFGLSYTGKGSQEDYL